TIVFLFLFFLHLGLEKRNTVDFPAAGILSKASCDPYRFVLIKEPKTWAEAQSYCREKHTDLATVQSDEDRAKLKEVADAVSFRSFYDWNAWIGLSKKQGLCQWQWSDQTSVSSSVKWESGQPDNINGTEECATADTDGQMTFFLYVFCIYI
uniref:C-type lectin domain-containing protein n=1 Tax=Sinocyclocheilus rhinocerous TaxID=307959 RepID=A0A673KJ21_9TELE